MLRRLLVPRAPSSAGGRWRWPRSSLLSAPFSSAASGGDGSSSGGSGSGSVPPPLHPHAPIHWKGHNLKPLRIKKKGIEAVHVRCWLVWWWVVGPLFEGCGRRPGVEVMCVRASIRTNTPQSDPPHYVIRTHCTTRARASSTASGTGSTSAGCSRPATWTSRRRSRGYVRLRCVSMSD